MAINNKKLTSLAFTGTLLLSLAAPISDADAGAWTRLEGEAEIITTFTFSTADESFDNNGNSINGPDFKKYEISPRMEYGFTDAVTILVQPYLQRVQIENALGGTDGDELVEADFGVRGRVWQDERSVVSIQGMARVPNSFSSNAMAMDVDQDPEIEGRLLVGTNYNLWDRTVWVNGELAYRHRFGDPADEIRADISSGVELQDKWHLYLQSFNIVSVGNAKGPFTKYRSHKVQGSVLYDLQDDIRLQAGLGHTVAGENIIRETYGILAVWNTF